MKSEFNSILSNFFNSSISELSKHLSRIGKITLDEYYGLVCDYIEKAMFDISHTEKMKCFGGKCVFSIDQPSLENKWGGSSVQVISEVTLYFQDVNQQWSTKKTSGKLDVEKFDMNDDETMLFIKRLKLGQTVEQKIDAPTQK